MQKKFLAAILAAAMLLSMLTGYQNRSTQVPLRFSGIPDIMDTIHPRQRSQCALAGFPFVERLPPAMRVRRKKFYLCVEKEPPDERE